MTNINLVIKEEHKSIVDGEINKHEIQEYIKDNNNQMLISTKLLNNDEYEIQKNSIINGNHKINKKKVNIKNINSTIKPFYESINFKNQLNKQRNSIRKHIKTINQYDDIDNNIKEILQSLIDNQKVLFNKLDEISNKLYDHTNNRNIHFQKNNLEKEIINNNNKIIHSQNIAIINNNNNINNNSNNSNNEEILEIIEDNTLKTLYKNLVVNDILNNN